MNKLCRKCGYERQAFDTAPDYECPKCGAVYTKVEARLRKDAEELQRKKEAAEKGMNGKLETNSIPHDDDLKKCKKCGARISATVGFCPQCGAKNPTGFANRNIAGVIFLCCVFFFAIVGWVSEYVGSDHESKREPKHAVTERVAAPKQTEEEKAESKKRRVAAQAAADAVCKKELQCWGDKNNADASVYCKEYVEKLAKFTYRWTDGWLEPKFSHFRWKDMSIGVITYIGDKIEFQNGFGAWQNHIYECDFNADNNAVLNVRASPGRL